MLADDVAHAGVQRALEAQVRCEPEGDGRVVDDVEDLPAQARNVVAPAAAQLEDRCADLADGLVQVVDVGGQPVPLLRLTGARDQALQPDRRSEDPLDDVVVQVAGDAVALLQDGDAVAVGAGLGQLERQRYVPGETRRHVDVGVGEKPALGPPAEHERPDTLP